jgi:orotidine-5'-phosphate decarboxylase
MSHDPVAERLIVALDVPDLERARGLVEALDGVASFFKLGPWLQLSPGFDRFVDELLGAGRKIFLDVKLGDIPETMKGGARAAAGRGISILTIHGNAEVSDEAMRAAVEGKAGSELKVVAVTVLTSLGGANQAEVEALALARARRALECGCDGVIASGHEARAIKAQAGAAPFLVITPGIRPHAAATGDQKRVVTPAQAIAAGADYLVVGRPIIHQPDPAEAARRILDEMRAAAE